MELLLEPFTSLRIYVGTFPGEKQIYCKCRCIPMQNHILLNFCIQWSAAILLSFCRMQEI